MERSHESIPFLVEIREWLSLGSALLPVKACLGALRDRGLVALKMTSPFALQSIFSRRSISHYPPLSSLSHPVILLSRLNHPLDGNSQLGEVSVSLHSPESWFNF